jgi:Domain of unknown function (DUF4160)
VFGFSSTLTKAILGSHATSTLRQGGREAKLWLRPGLTLAYNRGFGARELRDLREIVEATREEIEAAWGQFFD